MPPRSTPTTRQRRLGVELRKLREQAGLSASEAAARLSTERTKISNIETGRFGLSAERLRTITHRYACTDQALIDALVGMTGERKRGWWQEYREILPLGLLDIAELEHHAVELRTAQTATLPGLLQTADHARATFEQVIPPLPPPEVEHRVSHRIKRQAILFGEAGTPYTAVIHEAALRMQFGGVTAARRQLRYIAEMSERDNITVLVIPFSAGAYPGGGQTILYATGPTPQLDTAQIDQAHGPVFIDAAAQLARYRAILDRHEAVALKPAESRDFILTIAREL
ncbi:Scr1 family TA system antitoxin-like transcriptional regulator [Streptomyces sp. NPDC052496]|uniref:Scr1 family TA system antitoxin-like transcriptional regulator n=1 Tax=Streptomyces sp. NPDC052496 TaxID=3154951 RepID=UPI00342F213A